MCVGGEGGTDEEALVEGLTVRGVPSSGEFSTAADMVDNNGSPVVPTPIASTAMARRASIAALCLSILDDVELVE